MCLPTSLLKCWTIIASCAIVILGVASIVCAAVIGSNNLFISTVKEAKDGVFYLTIVLGVVLLLIAVAGFIGSCKDSKCCLTIYNIGTGIFMLLFLALGVAGLVVFRQYKQDIRNELTCQSEGWLQDAENFSNQGYQYLCSSQCPCDASNKTQSQQPFDYTINKNGATKIQDCPNFDQNFNQFNDEYTAAMEAMEDTFNCAGICTKGVFYMFTNINNGIPDDACGPKLMDYIEDYSTKIGAVALIVAALLLINVIIACCQCCKGSEERDGYQRHY